MFKKFQFPTAFKKLREGLEIIVAPLAVFQLIRTIFFPTTFDVVILAILALIYIALLKKIF
ncbi:hypothetical protein [Terrilactibacillus laevilacticus]|uniref:Membrane protein YszA n=1 Tax=Terrilactibacillus laevilacticus TaxID=1380157 RepID=A0ABW5PU40_9BACI|nr:hypothetical protein [Terrilactibacillus laevilacticus]